MTNVPVAPAGSKRELASPSMLDAALMCAAIGRKVFPLHSPSDAGCSCGKRACKSVGKHPRTQHGLKDACTDAAEIRAWWNRWPDANIGIATGPESGVWVLDVDGEVGQDSLAAMGPLPETLRVITGRKGLQGQRVGLHLYFRYPGNLNIETNAGRLGRGLDVRAAGGYVVAPPSLHQSGERYEWRSPVEPLADAPAWLVERITTAARTPLPASPGDSLYEGERNNRLYRLACNWRRHGAEEDGLKARLRGENRRRCKPPLDDEEIGKIVLSALKIPVGGLDPLEAAWEHAKAENHFYGYDKLIALIRHLEAARPGSPILLPVERIGRLFGVDHTGIGRLRRRAISEGIIQEVERYIPHQKATKFMVLKIPPR